MGERAFRAGLIAIASLLGLVACQEPAEPQAPPNVVLVSVDSVRADRLGLYGHPVATSPAIDALARESVVFENAITQAPWTLPAHAALFTATHPRSNRVHTTRSQLAGSLPTLAEVLTKAGYATAAVVSGPFFHRRFGLHRGFRHYDDDLTASRERSMRDAYNPATHQRALSLLDSMPEPFFLFLYYWDVHYDYVPPAPYDTLFDPDYDGEIDGRNYIHNPKVGAKMPPRDLAHLLALYDGEIRSLDGWLARLIDALDERDRLDDTLLVFTADHGDEFLEHGERGHAHSLYQELVHVPLLIRPPGGATGRRVAQRVAHVDIMPTVLELTGVSAPASIEGRSLAPLLRGEAMPARPVFTETSRFRRRKGTGAPSERATAVLYGEHKLIDYDNPNRPSELYDLAADPGERSALDAPRIEARLRAALASWREDPTRVATDTEIELDRETREQLRELGYGD